MNETSSSILERVPCFADFYRQSQYGRFPQEHRGTSNGSMRAFIVDQQAHSFTDPACDEWILGLPLRASCMTRFDFGDGWRRSRRGRGDALLVPPRTEVRYEITGPTRLLIVTWNDADLRALDQDLFGGEKLPFRAMTNRYVRNVLVERVCKGIWYDLAMQDDASRIFLDAALLQLAGSLLRCSSMIERQQPGKRGDIRRAVEFIRENYTRDLSLAEIATEARLSVFHFAREFRLEIGQSPYSYLQSRRLEAAEALLRRPEVDLDDVAQRSGFQNVRRLRAAIRAKKSD
jgi:AraC family transcriptional regulator